MVYRPDQPKASGSGDVYEHVLVAEAALGHPLPPRAEIHHVDGNPRNNTPSNLVICPDHAYHMLLHVRTRILRAGGNPNTDKWCNDCRQAKPFTAFNQRTAHKSMKRQSICRECSRKRWHTYAAR